MPPQYSPAFLKCVAEVLRQEGGYAKDPKDPGGETNFGISKRSYPDLDIKNLTAEQATDIYHRDYWLAVRGDELPFPIAMCVFDGAVNSGPGAAIRWLQQSLGVPVDGKLGAKTLAAASSAPDKVTLASRVVQRRILYVASLTTFATFGSGWVQRCLDVFRVAIAGI